MNENSKKSDSNEHDSNRPFRMSLDQLHQEQAELKAAKIATGGVKPSQNLFNAMSMFNVGMDFALIIALPLIAFIYLGNWLDQKYSTKYFVLIGILLAVFISAVGVYRQIQKLSKHLKK